MPQYRFLTGSALAATLAFTNLSAEAQLRYRVKLADFGEPVGEEEFFSPAAINNHGVVAGTGYRRGDEWYDTDPIAHIFRGNAARPLLGTDAFGNSYAYGINDRNQVVGNYTLPDTPGAVPYLYHNGRYQDLRVEKGTGSGDAMDINASGQVVGSANAKALFFDGTRSRYIDIPGAVSSQAKSLNDHGTVVGNAFFDVSSGAYESRAFVYDGREVKYLQNPLADSLSPEMVAVNNAGQMAARTFNPDDAASKSFIYGADGRWTQIAGLPSPAGEPEVTIVSDLNNQGWAVGRSGGIDCNEGNCYKAFLWRDGQTVSLNDLLVPWQAKRWNLFDAVAINDRGQITGRGFSSYLVYDSYVLTPVPEPEGWALLLAGLGVVGTVARRRAGRRR
nr:PEP-CTERM sorting domain-containing protein [Azohydromonas australica]